MREFKDKVAVITGAASGIGLGIAGRCVRESMKVVLADVEEAALERAVAELAAAAELAGSGGDVLAAPTDVSDRGQVEALAGRTMEAFGAVHLLVNNAGVSLAGPAIWEYTAADWAWIMGVNLMGVIHGLQAFVPLMLEQEMEGHIVNTASAFGLYSPAGYGAYSLSKHGAVSLSETLQEELAQRRARIGVSVLCPGLVDSNIVDGARNRPAALINEPAVEERRAADHGAQREATRVAMGDAMSPMVVADLLFAGLREGRFYIFTDDATRERVRTRMDGILGE